MTEGIGCTPALEFGIGVLRLDRKTRKDAGFLFRIPLGSCRFAFEVAVPIVIASPQGCYRSVRSRMPVLSATIFDAGLITTVWLPVRVLPAPPRTPMLTEISRGLTNTPRFCGAAGPACSLCREEGPLQRQFGAFCLWRPKTVSPERGKERPETRFACDRDRFAAKSFARNWDTMVMQ